MWLQVKNSALTNWWHGSNAFYILYIYIKMYIYFWCSGTSMCLLAFTSRFRHIKLFLNSLSNRSGKFDQNCYFRYFWPWIKVNGDFNVQSCLLKIDAFNTSDRRAFLHLFTFYFMRKNFQKKPSLCKGLYFKNSPGQRFQIFIFI